MVYTCEFKVDTIWSIKRESLKGIIGSNLWCEDIRTTIPDFKYKFWIREHNGDVAIFIDDDEDLKNTTVKQLIVSIPTADFKGDLSTDAEVPEGHKFHDWKNTVVLKLNYILDPDKKFFVDDILTLEFRGIIEHHKQPHFESLTQMLWDSKDDMDFTFIVGTGKIKAHKVVLRRHSAALAEMFKSNVNEIEIKDFHYLVVDSVLRLCYDLPCEASVAGFLDCLHFADFYDMPLIKELLAHQLSQKINYENVCDLVNKSIEYKCPTLQDYCINFISNCIQDRKPFNGAANLNEDVFGISGFHTVSYYFFSFFLLIGLIFIILSLLFSLF